MIFLTATLLLSGCNSKPPDEKQDGSYRVLFETTKGGVLVKVNPEWAPVGAKRFRTLVKEGYYNDVRIFRVIQSPTKFVAQFGISGNPETASNWRTNTVKDDPVKESNTRGRITFATSGPHSRTTQVFVNYGDNSRLDRQGFAPFGFGEEGMEVVDRFYSGYGNRAAQNQIHLKGNAYLDEYFPEMDTIRSARILGEE